MSKQFYSLEERLRKLNQIYDSSLDFVCDALEEKKFKGTFAAMDLMVKSRAEMNGLVEDSSVNNAGAREPITISFLADEVENVQADA